MRVLLIEDNQDLRIILELVLKHHFLKHHFAIQVIDAPDAEMGIELARQEQPDLILMDLMLPRISGFEAISILQATTETKDIPIVVISECCWEKRIREKVQEHKCLGCIDKTRVLEELPPLIIAAQAALKSTPLAI